MFLLGFDILNLLFWVTVSQRVMKEGLKKKDWEMRGVSRFSFCVSNPWIKIDFCCSYAIIIICNIGDGWGRDEFY